MMRCLKNFLKARSLQPYPDFENDSLKNEDHWLASQGKLAPSQTDRALVIVMIQFGSCHAET